MNYLPNSGVFPSQIINELFSNGLISVYRKIDQDQIQPASLDLRLGDRAWRVLSSFLPGKNATVEQKLTELGLHEIDLSRDTVLEKNAVYIVEIQESLKLSPTIIANTNPKSSTGRLDVFTRVIVDRGITFDSIPKGYVGPLYAEICPKSFPIIVRAGSRLSQIRFRAGDSQVSDKELQQEYNEIQLSLFGKEPVVIDDGVHLSVNLKDNQIGNSVIGYRAKHLTSPVDINKAHEYSVKEFWEPIYQESKNYIILDPAEFYILASKEPVVVSPKFAAEMVPFDPLIGEFRVHYAGFFDPGFGYSPDNAQGSRAVLEVRSHDVPFILEDGQKVGRLKYEKMAEVPEVIYGVGIGSNYQGQSLKLSKHFKME